MPYAASMDDIQRPNYLPHLYLVLAAPFVVAAAIYLDLAVGGVRNHTLPELLLSYIFLVVFTIVTSSIIIYMVWNETEPFQILSGAPIAAGGLILLLPPVEANHLAFMFWFIASGYVVVLSLLVILHNRDGDPDMADEVS